MNLVNFILSIVLFVISISLASSKSLENVSTVDLPAMLDHMSFANLLNFAENNEDLCSLAIDVYVRNIREQEYKSNRKCMNAKSRPSSTSTSLNCIT